jgi:hypothetical protein
MLTIILSPSVAELELDSFDIFAISSTYAPFVPIAKIAPGIADSVRLPSKSSSIQHTKETILIARIGL